MVAERASETIATTGATKTAHLHRRGDRDLGRELRVAALRDHDRAAVLGRVADDRDDHDRDEELVQPDRLAEGVQRVDEDLRDERGRDRRGAERDASDAAATTRRRAGSRALASWWMRRFFTVIQR